MNFQSNNWNRIQVADEAVIKVRYTYRWMNFQHIKKESDLYGCRENKLGQLEHYLPVTIVAMRKQEDGEECCFFGVAICSPNDYYSKEKGREIAAGRALKAYYRSQDEGTISHRFQDVLGWEDVHFYGEGIEYIELKPITPRLP